MKRKTIAVVLTALVCLTALLCLAGCPTEENKDEILAYVGKYSYVDMPDEGGDASYTIYKIEVMLVRTDESTDVIPIEKTDFTVVYEGKTYTAMYFRAREDAEGVDSLKITGDGLRFFVEFKLPYEVRVDEGVIYKGKTITDSSPFVK